MYAAALVLAGLLSVTAQTPTLPPPAAIAPVQALPARNAAEPPLTVIPADVDVAALLDARAERGERGSDLDFLHAENRDLTPTDPQQKIPSNPQNPQSPANPRRPIWKLFSDVGNDFIHIPSLGTAAWLGGGGAAALLVHPYDDNVNNHLISKGWTHSAFLPGKIVGYGATQFGVAFMTMEWGRHYKEPKVVHVGTDLLRAQILTQLLTLAVKDSVRRTRPDKSGGFSFPSGHASVTFASATVLQRHFGWKAWPAYTVASYVAASRLHENRHFASDVIFGAALGAVCGRTTTRHGRGNWALLPITAPGTAGVMIVARR